MKVSFVLFFISLQGIFSVLTMQPALAAGPGITATNPNQGTNNTAVGQTTPLTDALCTIILVLNGRIGRAIAAMAIIGVGYAFWASKISWVMIVTVGIGIGIIFGAKTVAIAMLPNTVKVTDTNGNLVTVTPDELIRDACPELN